MIGAIFVVYIFKSKIIFFFNIQRFDVKMGLFIEAIQIHKFNQTGNSNTYDTLSKGLDAIGFLVFE